MKNIKIVTLLILLLIYGAAIGQKNKDKEFEGFKKFLPYMIKGLQNETKSNKELDEKTNGFFQKPWETSKLNQLDIDSITSQLTRNVRFKIKKNYSGKWSLELFSKLKDYSSIEEIYKSDGALSNVFVDVSEIKILDIDGSSAYVIDPNKNMRINESKRLEFNSGQIQTTFPIKKEYSSLNGNVTITLKEYSDVKYKAIKKKDQDLKFDLGNYKEIRLTSISENIAYFELPTTIDAIEIVATNDKNELFSSHSMSSIPKVVYDFAKKGDLNDESIKAFIDQLSKEDIFDTSQIVKYETNGNIEHLYIFIKSEEVTLKSKKLDIKLDEF